MPEPRSSGPIRGSKVVGASGKPPRPRPELAEPEDVDDPRTPRRVVDYSLDRRAALGRLVLTATGAGDHLDPHPDLMRAAKHVGEPLGRTCPWCRAEDLVLLRFAWGDELGELTGRLRSVAELAEMAGRHGSFRVDEVEVCRKCSWHFRVRSFVLGDGVPRPALRVRRG